ncbi:hypothetical protein CQW23_22624 [Capsicum baccatum]|uniref:Protein kinase domain-containing protein n=1 Tax=Capsicum baccatum TaxID=33114 RepID=A0A2G2W1F6_CAPBA|nr:hypothetical protein CQW23_22624 [Capsicum baccatum]
MNAASDEGGEPQKVSPVEVPANMSLDEINILTGNFGEKALIAEGSYGRVYGAKLSNGQQAAIKQLDANFSPESETAFAEQVSRVFKYYFGTNRTISRNVLISFLCIQVQMVSRLKHEHFVTLMGYCLEANNRILVYEFATMGTLHDVLHGRKGAQSAEPGSVLTWNQRMKIACGVASGLEYLHQKVEPPIIHRDVRSSNVLLFDDFTAKVADFDLTNQSSVPLEIGSLLATMVQSKLWIFNHTITCSQFTRINSMTRTLNLLVFCGTGRKPVDYTMPEGEQSLVTCVDSYTSYLIATPLLSDDKVKECVDPKLNNEYPPRAIAKVAALVGLCVQDKPLFRPNMAIMVKALHPLLNAD